MLDQLTIGILETNTAACGSKQRQSEYLNYPKAEGMQVEKGRRTRGLRHAWGLMGRWIRKKKHDGGGGLR